MRGKLIKTFVGCGVMLYGTVSGEASKSTRPRKRHPNIDSHLRAGRYVRIKRSISIQKGQKRRC